MSEEIKLIAPASDDVIIVVMGCWIATHYRHSGNVPHHIYFKVPPSKLPANGDRVFFYETVAPESGHKEPGRGAIISVAKALGKLEKNDFANRDKWPFRVECSGHTKGFIPLAVIRKIIPRPFFRQTLSAIKIEECRELEAASRNEIDSDLPAT